MPVTRECDGNAPHMLAPEMKNYLKSVTYICKGSRPLRVMLLKLGNKCIMAWINSSNALSEPGST